MSSETSFNFTLFCLFQHQRCGTEQKDQRTEKGPYRFLSLPLVTLHFDLQLVDEVLHADQVLLVFLSLQKHRRKIKLGDSKFLK